MYLDVFSYFVENSIVKFPAGYELWALDIKGIIFLCMTHTSGHSSKPVKNITMVTSEKLYNSSRGINLHKPNFTFLVRGRCISMKTYF